MLTDDALQFLRVVRIAHLATADAAGVPHVVPVCFAVDRRSVYITIDEKPKRDRGRGLKRLRNIAENSAVALVADHYDDHDWSRLGWVMVRGPAEILDGGDEHALAQEYLRARYTQLHSMSLHDRPVIAIRAERVTQWGDIRTVTGDAKA
jgi:PPOX class probable F420-dependent enzyme